MSERPRGPRGRWAPVRVLALDTSGCGACVQSIAALGAPRYAQALRAAGVAFARSPRHADVVLLTGALSWAARAAVARTLAAVPEPRALLAIGDCAIDGCAVRGSPELGAAAAATLDVHVELPGCPPPPAAILAAILTAKRLLAGADGAADGPGDKAPDESEIISSEREMKVGGESEGGAGA